VSGEQSQHLTKPSSALLLTIRAHFLLDPLIIRFWNKVWISIWIVWLCNIAIHLCQRMFREPLERRVDLTSASDGSPQKSQLSGLIQTKCHSCNDPFRRFKFCGSDTLCGCGHTSTSR
jgi:hypothetical protein